MQKIANIFHARQNKNAKAGALRTLLNLNLASKAKRAILLCGAFFCICWGNPMLSKVSCHYNKHLTANLGLENAHQLVVTITNEIVDLEYNKAINNPNTLTQLQAEVDSDHVCKLDEAQAVATRDVIAMCM